jgi:hypothetical protein
VEVTESGIDPNLAVLFEAFTSGGKGQGTHRPYLLRVILQTTGPILELGVGEFSTPALHLVSLLMGRQVQSYDTEERWARYYYGLRTRRHIVEHVRDYADVPCEAQSWDVAFVDHGPRAVRGQILSRLTHVPFVVCHDSEDTGYGYTEGLRLFRYVRTFKGMSPWTTVASNTDDVTTWGET